MRAQKQLQADKEREKKAGMSFGERNEEIRARCTDPHDLPSLLLEAVEPLSGQCMITHSLARTGHITYGR